MRSNTLLLFLIICTNLIAESLPNLGTVTAGFTAQQEHALGQTWLRQYRKSISEINDPLVLDYLSAQIHSLKQHTSLSREPVSFLLIASPTLNAFAVPGKIMGVNSGLFLKAESEEQFMSVIAHELSHLELKHFNQQISNQKDQQKIEFLSLLTSLIIAQYSLDAGKALLAAGIAGSQVTSLAYSRTLETEADRRASEIMINAGYPTTAISSMLETLMKDSLNKGEHIPEYFRTHPLSETRVADSLRIGNNSTIAIDNSETKNSLEFELIRLKLSKHHNYPIQIKHQLNNEKFYEFAKTLLIIDELLISNRLLDAEKLLASFPDNIQTNLEVILRQARLMERKNQIQNALQLLEIEKTKSPYSVRINIELARLLRESGKTTESVQTLRELAYHYKNIPWLWFKLLEYSNDSTSNWIKYDADIQNKWLLGQEEAVINSLNSNLYSNKWTGIQKSRIRDRLKTFQSELDLIEETF